jgi:hypothetical protein
MINRYLRAPLIWDVVLSLISCLLALILLREGVVQIPNMLSLNQVASDVSTIGLTLTGFILTMLTVLITMKDGSTIDSTESVENLTGMELFFSTRLYQDTVDYLKRAIASLIIISLGGYIIRIFLAGENKIVIYYFTIVGTVILILTTIRCLIILNKVVNVQKL